MCAIIVMAVKSCGLFQGKMKHLFILFTLRPVYLFWALFCTQGIRLEPLTIVFRESSYYIHTMQTWDLERSTVNLQHGPDDDVDIFTVSWLTIRSIFGYFKLSVVQSICNLYDIYCLYLRCINACMYSPFFSSRWWNKLLLASILIGVSTWRYSQFP